MTLTGPGAASWEGENSDQAGPAKSGVYTTMGPSQCSNNDR